MATVQDSSVPHLEPRGACFGLDGEAQGDAPVQRLLQALLHLGHFQFQVDSLLLLQPALILQLLQPLRQRGVGTFALWRKQEGVTLYFPAMMNFRHSGTLSFLLTSSGFHSRAQVSPLLLQLGQMVPDLLFPLHQFLLLVLQPLGIGLHAILAVLALICICKTANGHEEAEIKSLNYEVSYGDYTGHFDRGLNLFRN